MTNLTKLTDYELVSQYKTGNTKIMGKIVEILYYKYYPFIENMAKKYYKNLSKDASITLDDICQTYILYIYKTLDGINLAKVSGKVLSFQAVFKHYITAYTKRWLEGNLHKTHSCVSTEDLPEFQDERNYFYTEEKRVSIEALIEDFKLEYCSSLQRKILSMFQKGYTNVEIAKKLKIKNQSVITYHKGIIKEKLTRYIKYTDLL